MLPQVSGTIDLTAAGTSVDDKVFGRWTDIFPIKIVVTLNFDVTSGE